MSADLVNDFNSLKEKLLDEITNQKGTFMLDMGFKFFDYDGNKVTTVIGIKDGEYLTEEWGAETFPFYDGGNVTLDIILEIHNQLKGRWGVLKVLENHNYDYWELNALKDNCQKKDFSIIWEDAKSLKEGEEQTALIYFMDEYVLDIVSFLADIRGSIDYVEDGFVQRPLTWYRNDLVFGVVVKATGTLDLIERLNRPEGELEEKK